MSVPAFSTVPPVAAASTTTKTTKTTTTTTTTAPTRRRRPATAKPVQTTRASRARRSLAAPLPTPTAAPPAHPHAAHAAAVSASASASAASSAPRLYRCSRCGQPGHNVRACPGPAARWFHQRCSRCGLSGHNARNCPGTGVADSATATPTPTVTATATTAAGTSRHASRRSLAPPAANVDTCRVCAGARRLPCAACRDAHPSARARPSRAGLAAAARARGRLVAAGTLGERATRAHGVVGAGARALSHEQRAMAERARQRARLVLDVLPESGGRRKRGGSATTASASSSSVSGSVSALSRGGVLDDAVDDDGTGLVGFSDAEDGELLDDDDDAVCRRCMGTGFLSCMACADD